jgi:hypothetical protein
MKYKLIRNGVLTASTILFISCLIKLLPNRNFQLFLIAGTLGLTGSTLVKYDSKGKKQKLDSTVQITENPDVNKQELLDQINRQTQRELQKANEKIFILEQQIRKVSSFTEQEFIEIVNRETQDATLKINEKIVSFEQQVKDTVKIYNSELQTLITKQNRQNQSAIDKLKLDLEKKIVQATANSEPSKLVTQGIIESLKYRGIEIEPTSVEYDSQLSILANHIAKNYNSLQDFRWRLIRGIKDNHAFEYCLRNKHNEDIQIHTVFGSELKKLGFYPEYKYIANNIKIMYIPACQDQARTKFIQFLNGGWFEIYTFNIIIEYLKNNSQLKYKFLLNSYANFFKDNDNRVYRTHELDLLFLIENNLIWIECKSGKVKDDELQKYSDNNQQFLKLPKQNALVVCFKISESDAAIKTQQYPGITIINPNSLLQSIETILNNRSISLPVLKSTTEIVEVKNKSLKEIDNQPVRVSS